MDNDYIEHPFENMFEIEPGSTILHKPDYDVNGMVLYDQYDEKEQEIEAQYQTIYSAAFAAFTDQVMSTQRGENPGMYGKNLEAAAKFLSTALDAVKEKAELKHKKDKTITKTVTATNVTNNNLIMDREDLISMLQGKALDG